MFLQMTYPKVINLLKKRFRESGAGKIAKALNVRKTVFEWFINVRETLKWTLVFQWKCSGKSTWGCVLSGLINSLNPLQRDRDWSSANIGFKTGWKSTMLVWETLIDNFVIKKKNWVERIQDYLKNIWMVRKYFLDTYGVYPPIINGDQLSLHRYKSVS